MGYTDTVDSLSGTGAAGLASAASAAGRLALETETWYVASSAGAPITVTDGDVMAIDVTALAAAVRVKCARRCAATTDVPVGVAFLNAPVTIPQTTAAGDLVVPILVMRRGFHNAVNVATGGAAGQMVGTSATVGRGAVPVAAGALVAGVQEANLVGVTLGAAAANLAPMWVCCQFG
jgi:hypothetical protein